jgi:hypothetical protein
MHAPSPKIVADIEFSKVPIVKKFLKKNTGNQSEGELDH